MVPGILPELFQALMDNCRNSLNKSARPRVDGEVSCPSIIAQLELDEQLEVIQRVVANVTAYAGEMGSRLRSRRNQLSAVSRLPADVLLIIFRHAKASIEKDFSLIRGARNYNGLAFPRLLLTLSSVCRLWRNFITQDCPVLWTKLPMASTSLMKLFLSRSMEVPLEIVFGDIDGGAYFSERISLVRPHISRCKSLHMSFHRNDDAQVVVDLLRDSAPAPHLEFLDLRHEGLDIGHPSWDPYLPAPFAGITPCLRKLRLKGIPIPLHSPIFRGLTRLVLECIDYSIHGSIHELLHALELSPSLEDLTLSHVGLSVSIADVRSIHALPVIILTQLRWLFLDCTDHLPHILHRLCIPPSCYLDLCVETAAPGDDLYRLLPSASVISANTLPLMQPIHTLMVQMDDDRIELRGCLLEPYREAYCIAQKGEGIPQRVLSNLGRIFPLASLEELDLTVDTTENSPDLFSHLVDFLHRHPTINTIICEDPEVLELLVVTPAKHLCPLLHSLRLRTPSSIPYEPVMIRLVESRVTRGGGENNVLRHVTLWGRGRFSDSGLAALRELTEVEVR
ncbi:hypothetical protein BOTBODRAFT_39987 [Botryobasidium botryosum FD-172 SS1]|uniref:Uncharacterized protein n=1 Tax=Botryobasidium botryosum (strain FD-172 SS1) TaxID=930990 RepID=A0A067M1F3_BOTB1|nr:hypothetical protein BOTBODRAFT_39987 [Botryobasidium botryosum FD-172 SS1]